MIYLTQNMYGIDKYMSRLKDLPYVDINIDKDILMQDIKKLKALTVKGNNKKNINCIIEYLNKLYNKIDKCGEEVETNFEISNIINDGCVIAYPIAIENFYEYGINATNYISTKEKILDINTSNISDIITVDMAYRDLGFTKDEVEECMGDGGLIESIDCKYLELLRKDGFNPYEYASRLTIKDSQYLDFEHSLINNYFYSNSFKCCVHDKKSKYGEVLANSCRVANNIIASYIIDIHKDIEIVSINCRNIVIKSSNIDTLKNIMNEKILIRSFGRIIDTMTSFQLL